MVTGGEATGKTGRKNRPSGNFEKEKVDPRGKLITRMGGRWNFPFLKNSWKEDKIFLQKSL